MFGKPEWFKEKSCGWGITPVAWQGWVYTLVWSFVLTAPFIALLTTRREIEAIIWLVASTGALIWDVHGIVQAIRSRPPEVLFIDEHGARRLEDAG